MVSIITCTVRQNFMDNVFRNYASQKNIYKKELIIILNSKKLNYRKWAQKAKKYPNVSVYMVPDKTLGECLNFGIQKAKYPIVAKMDDDDYYAPLYLPQAIHALITKDVSLVGKYSRFTYFEGKKLLAVMTPHRENKFHDPESCLAGGTLVFKKDLFPRVRFPATNNGEDVLFQVECARKGHKIYSTDRHYYVYIRRANHQSHTWSVKDEDLLKTYCEIIGRTLYYKWYAQGIYEHSFISCTPFHSIQPQKSPRRLIKRPLTFRRNRLAAHLTPRQSQPWLNIRRLTGDRPQTLRISLMSTRV
ncbi:glycosyltransferase [Desmospora profundinema]|uniref:Glycosyltransferase involved in cell wall biosynthesis n=1 Tax=Desmospora profundinema TaxID=1571184 RepID=A0ABU1IJ75_9BACL|nr:glycosyltransferase [Desmospora profundinema]MDR6224602.1 glycosyltransferase involved in cell wall biosynthesis [Desmospora profundinema]